MDKTVLIDSDGFEASANEDEGSPERSPSPARSEQHSQSGQSSDEIQEVCNEAREEEVSLELELAAKRKRKELRAKKRTAREAKAQAFQSKSNTHINSQKTNYNTPPGSAAREHLNRRRRPSARPCRQRPVDQS